MTLHSDAIAAIDAYEAELTRLTSELATTKVELARLTSELTTTTTANTALKAQVASLQAQIVTLTQQVKDLQAQIAAGTPPTTPPPTTEPPATTHPPGWLPPLTYAQAMATGNYLDFDNDLRLPSDDVTETIDASGRRFRAFGVGVMQKIFNRLPDNKGIAFQDGTFEANEPGWTNGDQAAIQTPKGFIGMAGNDFPGTGFDDLNPKRTTIRVKPYTGAAGKNVLGAWFKVGYSGSRRFDISNIHFEGTEQGYQASGGTGTAGPGNDGTSRKLFTNLFVWNVADGCTARDILSTGSFGNSGAPPGETFDIEWYHSTGAKLCRIYTDGRRAKGGPIYSGVGLTFGNALRCTVVDSNFHHGGQAGLVFYQTAYCKSYNVVLGSATDKITTHVSAGATSSHGPVTNGCWLNHERTTGSEHYNMTLNNYGVNKVREHISHSNDTFTLSRSGENISLAAGTLLMVDPTWSPVLFAAAGYPITVATWIPYSNGNTQKVTDKPVFRKADGSRIPAKWNYGSTWMDI